MVTSSTDAFAEDLRAQPPGKCSLEFPRDNDGAWPKSFRMCPTRLRSNDRPGIKAPVPYPDEVEGRVPRLLARISQCSVKGVGPQRVRFPPGNWFAPPGSNRSSGLGNEATEAFGVEGREGDLASVQAVM